MGDVFGICIYYEKGVVTVHRAYIHCYKIRKPEHTFIDRITIHDIILIIKSSLQIYRLTG